MKNNSSFESRLADSYSEAASSLGSAGFTNLSGSDTFDTATGSSTGTTADTGDATGTSDATSGFGGGLGGTGGRDKSGSLGGSGGEARNDYGIFDPTPSAQQTDTIGAGGFNASDNASGDNYGFASTTPSVEQKNTIGAGGVNPGAGGRYVQSTDAYASPTGFGQTATDRAATFSNARLNPAANDSILGVIRSAEAQRTNQYNSLVDGRGSPKHANLTGMTVKEVMDYQKGMIAAGHASTAVGAYQTIASTLKAVVAAAGIDPTTTRFDEATQDKIARTLMEGRGLSKFEAGKMTKAQFADNLAGEWAGLPLANGESRYKGINGNKARVSRSAVIDSLTTDPDGIVSHNTEVALYEPGAVIDDIDRPGSAANPKGKVYDVDRPRIAPGTRSAADQPKESQTASLSASNGDEQPRAAPDATPVKTISITPTGETESPRDPVERLESIYLTPHSTPSELAAQSAQDAIRPASNLDGSTGLAGAAEQKTPGEAPQAPAASTPVSPAARVANAFEDFERKGTPAALAQVSPATRVANAFADVEQTGTSGAWAQGNLAPVDGEVMNDIDFPDGGPETVPGPRMKPVKAPRNTTVVPYGTELEDRPIAKILYSLGPKRPHKPSSAIEGVVASVVGETLGTDYTVRVVSGQGEYGSARRHPVGKAIDFDVIAPDGRVVTDPETLDQLALDIAGRTRGSTGLAHDGGYMGNGRMHVDYVRPRTIEAAGWSRGKGTSPTTGAQAIQQQLYEAGLSGGVPNRRPSHGPSTSVQTSPYGPAGGDHIPANQPAERPENIYLSPYSAPDRTATHPGQEAIRNAIRGEGSLGSGRVGTGLSPSTRVANAFEDYERTGRSGASEQLRRVAPEARKVRTVAIAGETTPTSAEPRAPVEAEPLQASTTTPVDGANGITINPTVGTVLETGINLAAGAVNPIFGAANTVVGLAGGPTIGSLATRGIEWALNHPGEQELLARSARYDGTVNGNGDEPLRPVQTPTEDTPDETEEERLDSLYLNPVEEIWRPKPHERWGPDARRYR